MKVAMIKKLFQKGSSWMTKTPSKLSVCILTVLVYVALLMGNLKEYQQCPCIQHRDETIEALRDIEETLRKYNEGKTVEYEERRRKGNSNPMQR